MKLLGIVLLVAFLATCTSVPLERDIKNTLDSVDSEHQGDLNTPRVRLVRQFGYFPYYGGGGLGGGGGYGSGFGGAGAGSFSSSSSTAQSGAYGSGFGGGLGNGGGFGAFG